MSPARRSFSATPAKELRTTRHSSDVNARKVVYQPSKNKRSSVRAPLQVWPKKNENAGLKKENGIVAFFNFLKRGVFVILGCMFVLCLVGVGVIFWYATTTQANTPTATYLIVNESSKTDTTAPTAIILRSQPELKGLQVVVLKPSMTLALPGDYGQYPLDSVLPLLQLEKQSPVFTRAVMSLGLGVVVDEVVGLEKLPVLSSDGQLTTQSLRSMMWQAIHSREGEALPLSEATRLYALSWQLGQNQLMTVQAESLEQWQKQASSWPTSQAEDTCTVAIVNTTKTSGVATALTSVLERSQLVVVKAVDTVPARETSHIVLAKEGCDHTVAQLETVVPSDVDAELNQQLATQYRSDVVLFVGNDVAQFVK